METHQIYDRLENMAFSRLGLVHRSQLRADLEEQMRQVAAAFAVPTEMFNKAASDAQSSFAALRASLLQGPLKAYLPPPRDLHRG